MSQQASCPSCGGTVEFKVGTSLVAVCPYCRSVVGRGDKGLEDLGKVADVSETGSPLDLWLQGRFDGRCVIGDHVWLGVGPGNFGRLYPRYMATTAVEKVQDPHNFVLELWATCGIFAVAAWQG